VLGTALTQTLLILIGLWVTGIPGALLLGRVLFLLALIPFGPALVWGPAVGLALPRGPHRVGDLCCDLEHRGRSCDRERTAALTDQPRQ
jgi:hypothetical protein